MKRAVSKRVVLADVPPERKPERGHVRQNHPFGNRPFISQMTLFGVDKRVVSKRVVSADVPPERKPERGYVRQNHPFTKPPFYLPVSSKFISVGRLANGYFVNGHFEFQSARERHFFRGLAGRLVLPEGSSLFPLFLSL